MKSRVVVWALVLAFCPEALGSEADARREGLPELLTECPGSAAFGGSATERAAWCLLWNHKYTGLRRLAQEALAADSDSFRGHYLMGVAQHLGEGNLPRSRFHLERSMEGLVAAYGRIPRETAPTLVYRRALQELVYVNGEMELHDEKMRYVDWIDEVFGGDFAVLKAWSLMKLKRYDEAKAIAEETLRNHPDSGDQLRSIALTALCALESEQRNREASYHACREAARIALKTPLEGAVALSNAGASAMEMMRFHEAERMFIEAARRPIEGTVNPWGRLTRLYLRQARFAEAVAALREMISYRRGRPAYYDQQDQADADMTAAAVLLVAGEWQASLRISERMVVRPDRQGTSSGTEAQGVAGNLLFHRVVLLESARRLEEKASWSTWGDAFFLHAEAKRHRLNAYLVGRAAATRMSTGQHLVSSLRPECPGSIELPAWLDLELIHVVGAGPSLAAIALGRKQETLSRALAEPVFQLLSAEAEMARGQYERALVAGARASRELLTTESLLRARADAIAAKAAEEIGNSEDAYDALSRVLRTDPGLLRRMGFHVPVTLAMMEAVPAVHAAESMLKGSPLFEVKERGFVLELSRGAVRLRDRDGSLLLEKVVEPPSAEAADATASARAIAETAHAIFSPPIDLTQADLRSLDGSLIGGGSASDRVEPLIDELIGPE